MKFVATTLLAVIGSAAAFAPMSRNSKAKVATKATAIDELVGALEPVGFFDQLRGLSPSLLFVFSPSDRLTVSEDAIDSSNSRDFQHSSLSAGRAHVVAGTNGRRVTCATLLSLIFVIIIVAAIKTIN